MNAAAFEPRHPAYADRVRASLESQPFMSRLLGAAATQIEPGRVEIALTMQADFRQPQGHAHGVVLSALADSAAGYAAQTLLGPDLDVVTVEYKINYLAPAFGERLVARGWVIRAGRTLQVCAADVFAITGSDEKLVAHMATTMMAVAAENH